MMPGERKFTNNRVISNLLTAYQNLVPDEFQEVINTFQAHAYAFEKHCENPYFDYSEHQFPKQFPQLILMGLNGNLLQEVTELDKQVH
jgi:hypothetical protein